MVLRTRVTQLLGCKHPIILPGMSWISTPPLVSAVSNAGGCGILATGPLSPEETATSIREIQKETSLFGVGATLAMPGARENALVAVDCQVPVLNISLGKDPKLVQAVHAYGGKVIATVTTVSHAKAALEAGADALQVTGYEAAAHGGEVPSSLLVQRMRKQFPKTPIVGAGGFATGPSLASALVLGADGVAMGTRLACTLESPLPLSIKQAMEQGDIQDTVYGSNFDGIPARVLKTPVAQQLMQSRPWLPTIIARAFRSAVKMNIPLIKVLPGLVTQFDKMYMVAQFGAATSFLEKASIDGDLEKGVQFVGQCQGLVDDIPMVEELLDRIVEEAEESLHVSREAIVPEREAIAS